MPFTLQHGNTHFPILTLKIAIAFVYTQTTAYAEEKALTTETIQITAPKIIEDIGVSSDRATSNVQSATSKEIAQRKSADLAEFMNSSMQSVNVNEYSGNAFQMDLNYRGFTASPLLGTPQGLSVYLDGARVNEAFGDVVNWDLIPMSAIANIDLVPGSNPVYGLNTLGGAISLRTKNGFDDTGLSMTTTVGSWGRQQYQMSAGANKGPMAGFMALNYLDEDGWRDYAPSTIKQGFGRLDFRTDKLDISASMLVGDTSVTGNGLTPKHLLGDRWSSVLSAPDNTKNKLTHYNISGNYWLTENSNLHGMVYLRDQERHTLNGDINDSESFRGSVFNGTKGAFLAAGADCDAVSGSYNVLFTGTNNTFRDPRICRNADAYDDAANNLGLIDDSSSFLQGIAPNAIIHYSDTTQLGRGNAFKYNITNDHHNFTAGLSLDANKMQFLQSEEFAYLDDNRIVHTRPVLDPMADPHTLNSGKLLVNNLLGRTVSRGYYLNEIWTPNERLSITSAVRYAITDVRTKMVHYNWRVENISQPIFLPVEFSNSSDNQTFRRVNPALGASWKLNNNVSIYGSVSKGGRAPSPIELGCARVPQDFLDTIPVDEQWKYKQSCSVQSVLTNDPPLKDIISYTYEMGARGRLSKHWGWNATAFRTDLLNDITFTIESPSFITQFINVDRTRREGIELGLTGDFDHLHLKTSYGLTSATYQSTYTTGNSANSSANLGTNANRYFEVTPGDRLPGVPLHTLKISSLWEITPKITLGADLISQSFVFLRGNENNRHVQKTDATKAGNQQYDDSGMAPGFGIINMNAKWQISKEWSAFMKINNVLDKRYYTGGELRSDPYSPSSQGLVTANGFNFNTDDWHNVANLAPGAPRAAWVGLTYELGSKNTPSHTDSD